MLLNKARKRFKKLKLLNGRHVRKIFRVSFRVLRRKGPGAYARFLYRYIFFGTDYFRAISAKNNLDKTVTGRTENKERLKNDFRKFNFVDGSDTWYGIAKQLERHLIRLGYAPDKEGTTLCFANDIGEIDPASLDPINPSNRITLKRALDSKAEFLFYSQKSCQKWFEKRKNSFYLPSGADTSVFKLYPAISRDIDVGFVGKNYGNPIRNNFLESLETVKNFCNLALPPEGELFFEKLARFYNRCKIVVNDSQQNEITMRMFEATACGCLLIARKVPFVEELFEPSEEIILYENFEEMIEKIKYYLSHEEERKNIAAKGARKTRLVHCYGDRAKFIANKVRGEKIADFMKDAEVYRKVYVSQAKREFLAQERLFDDSLPDTGVKWNIRERMKKTVELCRGDVLDVGTQRGGYLYHLKNKPEIGRLAGIDISEEHIRDAKKIQPDLEFIAGRIEKLPFPDRCFDTVIAAEILEHIPELEKGVRELKRVMKESGQLLISVPDYDYQEDPYHLRNFTRFDFTQMFAGMRVEFIDLENCLNILVRITRR